MEVIVADLIAGGWLRCFIGYTEDCILVLSTTMTPYTEACIIPFNWKSITIVNKGLPEN